MDKEIRRRNSRKYELIAMSEKAKGISEVIIEKMESMGTFREEYIHMIELLANLIDGYNECLRIVTVKGYSEETEKGGLKTLPEAGMLVNLGAQIKQVSEQLMLTPRTAKDASGKAKAKDPAKELIMKLGKAN